MLAKLEEKAENLSLCFDPTSDTVGEFDDKKFFEDGGQHPKQNILDFCEKFEQAGIKTKAFVDALKDLLMDSGFRLAGPEHGPAMSIGFQMVDQEKLRALDAETLKTWNENGMLAVIHAHILSLDLMRQIFARQVQQGKGPKLPSEAAKG